MPGAAPAALGTEAHPDPRQRLFMYLQRLTAQLRDGLGRLAGSVRTQQAQYLRSAQNSDGGFSGREGGSDLYYTGFALRGLAVLGELSLEIAEKTAAFLGQSLTRPVSVVDFYSLLYGCGLIQAAGGPDVLASSPADWPARVAATLESFRTSDGGYGKATDSASGSTYHTFLVGLSYELLGRGFPDPDSVLRFVASRQRDDGGYVEIAPMKRSGTNPTAAAVGIVQLIRRDQFDPAAMNSAADFLAGMPSMEGGLCANGRIPVADLLSTFTGTWTLAQLSALDRIDTRAALAYAQSLADASGGFRGGIWDERSDVEYTFYGLGTLGLLSGRG